MTGSTVKPRAEIRNGYSLVPWADPRYLTTRSRRVETSSRTRWSSAITQSVTYSSIPCRVRLVSPRSPVTMVVTPRSFEPARQPAELGPHDRVVAERAEQHLDGIEHDPPGAHPADGVVEDGKQRPEVELAGPDDLGGLYREREHHELTVPLQLVEVEAERAHVAGDLGRDSSKLTSTPGSPYSRIPVTRKVIPSSVLPAPALPATSVTRPSGSPPPVIWSSPGMPVGDFVQFRTYRALHKLVRTVFSMCVPSPRAGLHRRSACIAITVLQ